MLTMEFMNKIFKVIWNVSLNQWVVTSELGKSHHKQKSSKIAKALIASALASVSGGIALAEVIEKNDSIEIINDNLASKQINGITFDDVISGTKTVTFKATDVQYKPVVSKPAESAENTDDEESHFDENGQLKPTSTGDRYGRSIQLLTKTEEGNDFVGDVKVTDGVILAIGGLATEEKQRTNNALGKNNNLLMEGFTTVTLYDAEQS